jgi:hypothetical protein
MLAFRLGLTPNSNVWVGAWWIGFLLSAFLCTILAVPVLAFPPALPGKFSLSLEDQVLAVAILGSAVLSLEQTPDPAPVNIWLCAKRNALTAVIPMFP